MSGTSAGKISFVLPCLNEERTLRQVLEAIKRLSEREFKHREVEVVVSDNGSTDRSRELAKEMGARVVRCSERGYGAALRCGFEDATGDILIFGDADGTYDFEEAGALISRLEEGYDLVLGSRLRGRIEPGAMPFLHRYVGTPILTALINRFYSKNSDRISDCNSGMRCFKKSQLDELGLKSSGMEFASEMIIKAMASGMRVSEVPITLRPDEGGRVPHLKTWRDGMRHLLRILLHAPHIFESYGVLLWATCWIIIVFGIVLGPRAIFGVNVFGLHTFLFASFGTLAGNLCWGAGLILSARYRWSTRFSERFLDISEDWLLAILICLGLVGGGFIAKVFFSWEAHGFVFLDLEAETLVALTMGMNLFLMVYNLLMAHMILRD